MPGEEGFDIPQPLPARQELETVFVETVSDEEARNILQKTEIHGEPLREQSLTREHLEREGLLPKHKVRVGNSVVWFSSSAYEVHDSRLAVVAYIEKGERIVARTYYRSNSQGIWRYLPEYTLDENGDIGWYAKGWGEEDITLPIPLQKALAEITKQGMPILKPDNPKLIFAGTARKKGREIKATHFFETDAKPQRLEGNFYPQGSAKIPPEQLTFRNPRQSPVFTKLLTAWEQDTSLYGKISIEVFPSKDGKFRFMFCRDELGRAWIGGVENDSEVQTTGLRKEWVETGDLATPAYEYVSHQGGYGNPELRKGRYMDMYKEYLSKIPVIQEYLRISVEPAKSARLEIGTRVRVKGKPGEWEIFGTSDEGVNLVSGKLQTYGEVRRRITVPADQLVAERSPRQG